MSKQNMFHLLVVLSPHGFGHAAMTAPVVNAFCRRHPNTRVTLRTTLPEWFLRSKYNTKFEINAEASDFGFVMHNAFSVDTEASLAKYRNAHRNWAQKIEQERKEIHALAPDLVLSNVAYLPLVAAKQESIPAIGLCCLNWADLFAHFMGASDLNREIEQQIRDAYLERSAFICPNPSMPMPWLAPHCVGPLGSVGQNKRQQILNKLSLDDGSQLVLTSLGGIKTGIDTRQWPYMPNVHYLVPKGTENTRQDCHFIEDIDIAFIDLLASCDAFLTKPGYGSFSEAALNGVPVLYTERDDWPEQHYLNQWLAEQVPQYGISQKSLGQGMFADELSALLASTSQAKKTTSGIDETVKILSAYR